MAGREHDRLGGFRQDLVHAELVVAIAARGGAQFAEEMDEVVGKAVVVIDQRQHGGGVTLVARAPSRREASGPGQL